MSRFVVVGLLFLLRARKYWNNFWRYGNCAAKRLMFQPEKHYLRIQTRTNMHNIIFIVHRHADDYTSSTCLALSF